MVATFIVPRVPVPIRAYNNMCLEASSYFLLAIALLALLTADLIVDWQVITEHRGLRNQPA